MQCQFDSFGGPWADPRSSYIVGSIQRPSCPTLWAVGVAVNNEDQYYQRALHFAIGLTLAEEILNTESIPSIFRELVQQVTKVREMLAAME